MPLLMLTLRFSFASLMMALGTAHASAETLGWNFTDLDATYDTGAPSNFTVSDFSPANSKGTVATPVDSVSASSGYPGATGTGNFGNAVNTGVLDIATSSYYEITFTPAALHAISLTDFDFGTRSTSTGPQAYGLRSSIDAYAADIITGAIANNSTWIFKDNTFPAITGAVGAPVTFRLYTYGGTGNAVSGTKNNRLDDIAITAFATTGSTTSPLTLVLESGNMLDETAPGNTLTAHITRGGDPAAALTVNLSTSDPGDATVPATVAFPAGAANSLSFTITGVDDGVEDGPQSVTITASAPGYSSGTGVVTVADTGTRPALIINEFFARGSADANNDGSNAQQLEDEFVELVNAGAAAFDLSGFRLSDSTTQRHIFPAGTVLLPGEATVVFGGGAIVEGHTAAFGNAWVQKASTGSLSLSEAADSIILSTGANIEIMKAVFGAEADIDHSLNRSPDSSLSTFADHASLLASALPYSPGTQPSQFSYHPLTIALAAAFSAASAAEGTGPVTLTITRPGPTDKPLTVQIFGTGATTVSVPAATVGIPAGQASVDVAVTIIDDLRDEPDAAVTLYVVAAGFLNGSAVLTIVDNDATLPVADTVWINEIDSDQPGTDAAEFVELYTGSAGAKSLDGYVLLLFNGNASGNTAYGFWDLTGYASNAQGFFTLGSTGNGYTWEDPGFTLQNGIDAVALFRKPDPIPDVWPPNSPTETGLHNGQAVVYNNGTAAGADDLTTSFGTLSLTVLLEGPSNAATRSLSRRGDGGAVWFSQVPTPNTTNGGAASLYDNWAAGFPGTGGPMEDSDGDGLPNLVEYATGTAPNNKASSAPPVYDHAARTFSVVRAEPGASDPGLQYIIEGSADLATWSATANLLELENSSTRLAKGYLGSNRLFFFRLKLVLTP